MSQRHSGVFSSRLRHSVHTSGHSWVILMCTIFVHREAVLVPSLWNIGKYVRHFNSQVQCRSKWAKSLRFKAKRHPGGMLGDERSPPNWEALRAHKSRYGSPPLRPTTEAHHRSILTGLPSAASQSIDALYRLSPNRPNGQAGRIPALWWPRQTPRGRRRALAGAPPVRERGGRTAPWTSPTSIQKAA